MSIRDIQEKIKIYLREDRYFYTSAGVLLAMSFFMFGRLSADVQKKPLGELKIIQKEETRTSTQIAAPIIAGEPQKPVEDRPSEVKKDEASQQAQGAYVGSKNSDRYHLPWCSGAARIAEANKVWFATKEDAEKAGYKPAGNCPGI